MDSDVSQDKDSSLDVLGAKAYGEALKVAIEKSFDGAEAFLKRICLPAADELGLLLRDKVRYWRLANIIKIIKKTKGMIKLQEGNLELTAHPRVVMKILEEGSWQDDDEIQSMWAGLLASSCTKKGKDEGNLVFINTLNQLTSAQAKILNYLCKVAKMTADKYSCVSANHIYPKLGELIEISGIEDIFRLEREIDHLESLGLITTIGIVRFELPDDYRELDIGLAPSELAIYLYVRCQGYLGSPKDFFGLKREYIENKRTVIAD